MHEVNSNVITYFEGFAAGRREGILQVADYVDCGCLERSLVAGHLAAGRTRKAADACRNMGRNCCAISAHEIRELAKDEKA